MPDFHGSVLLLANYLHDRQESMQRFASLLAAELPRRGIATELIQPAPILGRLKPAGHGLGKWLGYADKFVLFPAVLKRHLRRLPLGAVLHICDHSNAVYTRYTRAFPHLVTCHDLLAIRSARGEIPENPTGRSGRAFQRMILNGLNRARRVPCVSKTTRDDLLRITTLGTARAGLVYNGLNYPFRPMPAEEASARLRKFWPGQIPSNGLILHVGGNQWYKNRAGVIGIYRELVRLEPAAPALALVGKPLPAALLQELQKPDLAGRVAHLQNCGNEDLRALYSTAGLLLFPSLMEGFGWPIIEAQACGCPVATSDLGPMNEIGGAAAALFDPRDWPAAARKIQAVLRETGAARAARVASSLANAALFTTDRMIDGYLQEYQTTLSTA